MVNILNECLCILIDCSQLSKTCYNVTCRSVLSSADVQRITLNASCTTISGERTEQVDIFCRVTGFTSDFLSFIHVELIRFFHSALQLCMFSFFLICELGACMCVTEYSGAPRRKLSPEHGASTANVNAGKSSSNSDSTVDVSRPVLFHRLFQITFIPCRKISPAERYV